MKPVTLPPTLRSTDPDYTRERFDLPQAAAYLDRSTDFIYREAHAGRLSYRRDSRRARFKFSQADLDAYRAVHRVEAKAPSTVLPPRRAIDRRDVLQLPSRRRFA